MTVVDASSVKTMNRKKSIISEHGNRNDYRCRKLKERERKILNKFVERDLTIREGVKFHMFLDLETRVL